MRYPALGRLVLPRVPQLPRYGGNRSGRSHRGRRVQLHRIRLASSAAGGPGPVSHIGAICAGTAFDILHAAAAYPEPRHGACTLRRASPAAARTLHWVSPRAASPGDLICIGSWRPVTRPRARGRPRDTSVHEPAGPWSGAAPNAVGASPAGWAVYPEQWLWCAYTRRVLGRHNPASGAAAATPDGASGRGAPLIALRGATCVDVLLWRARAAPGQAHARALPSCTAHGVQVRYLLRQPSIGKGEPGEG